MPKPGTGSTVSRLRAVDATGAGDAFTGAFLAELARDRGLAAAAQFANAAASLSTLGYGAVAPLPRREEVERLLAATTAATEIFWRMASLTVSSRTAASTKPP